VVNRLDLRKKVRFPFISPGVTKALLLQLNARTQNAGFDPAISMTREI